MKKMLKFNANNYIIVRNPVTSQTIPQINNLLTQAFPRVVERTTQDWLKIMRNGAEIITCIHKVSGDVVGIIIFLPINRPGDVYLQQYVTEINKKHSQFKEILIKNLLQAAKPYINQIDWRKITIEKADLWYDFFPNQNLTYNAPTRSSLQSP